MPTLGLFMIVKNEEEVLDRCLKSFTGDGSVFDEIILVDTGSTDATKQIAQKYGCKIYDFKWVNDFSKARNFAKNKTTTEWVFWCDGDDVLLEKDFQKLKQLKPNLSKDMYILPYDYFQDENGKSLTTLYRERIIKNDPKFQFNYPIHECIPMIAGASVEQVEIIVTHKRTNAGQTADLSRNIKMLDEAIKKPEYANDPRVQYYLAKEIFDAGQFERAIKELSKFVDMKSGWYEDVICALHKLAECYRVTAKSDLARQTAFKAINMDYRWAEPYYVLGMLAMDAKDWQQAIQWFELCRRPVPPVLSPTRPDFYTWLPNLQLCVCYNAVGDLQKSHERNAEALKQNPKNQTIIQNDKWLKKTLSTKNNPSKETKVGWYVLGTDLTIPQYRIRTYNVSKYLQGCKSEIFTDASRIREFDVIIFDVAYRETEYNLMVEARNLGKKVIINLCEAMFEFNNPWYIESMKFADLVVCCSNSLMDLVREKVTPKVHVIEDAMEVNLAQNCVYEDKKELIVGWCFLPGQEVLSGKGYQDIAEIKIGDKVLSKDGKKHCVINRFDREYKGDAVKIDLRKFQIPIHCTAGHKFPIIRPQKCSQRNKQCHYLCADMRCKHRFYEEYCEQIVEASQLCPGDFLLYPRKIEEHIQQNLDLSKYNLRIGGMSKTSVNMSSEFLELLGYYIAEGSSSKAGIKFDLNVNEIDLKQRIQQLFRSVWDKEVYCRTCVRDENNKWPKGKWEEIRCSSVLLADLYPMLCGRRSKFKHIPNEIMNLPAEQLMSVVEAIWEGDGFKNNGNSIREKWISHLKVIVSTSKKLALQIFQILVRNGYYPYLQQEKIRVKATNCTTVYRVGWSTQKKSNYSSQTDKYYLLPVKKITTYPYEGKVFNITVEETHNYLIYGFITQNCGMGGGAPQAERLQPLFKKHGYKLITIHEHSNATIKWDLNTWASELAKCDIAVAPNNYKAQPHKSSIKLTTYMGLGLPVIAVPQHSYARLIQDGQNAFLADNDEQWEKALIALKDVETRKRIGQAGKAVAYAYKPEVIASYWRNVIADCLGKEEVKQQDLSVDIIIPTYDNPKYLEECIKSVKECTDVPYNIIVVDAKKEKVFNVVFTDKGIIYKEV